MGKIGNEYWKLRKQHGRHKRYTNAETLLNDAYRYFDYVMDNPLEEVIFVSGKRITVKRERPFTVTGLLLFIDLPKTSFYQMAKDSDLSYAYERIKSIIWVQKFQGACVGIFNPKIIARELYLYHKKAVDYSVGINADT